MEDCTIDNTAALTRATVPRNKRRPASRQPSSLKEASEFEEPDRPQEGSASSRSQMKDDPCPVLTPPPSMLFDDALSASSWSRSASNPYQQPEVPIQARVENGEDAAVALTPTAVLESWGPFGFPDVAAPLADNKEGKEVVSEVPIVQSFSPPDHPPSSPSPSYSFSGANIVWSPNLPNSSIPKTSSSFAGRGIFSDGDDDAGQDDGDSISGTLKEEKKRKDVHGRRKLSSLFGDDEDEGGEDPFLAGKSHIAQKKKGGTAPKGLFGDDDLFS